MATLLRVPEVAAGATEAVLSHWLVKENVPFATGEPIVVIETEKASVEVEAEADAVILRTLVSDGSGVEVGSPMALIGDASEQGADIDKLLAELGVSGPVAEKEAPARREVPETPAAAPAAPTPTATPTATPAATPAAATVAQAATNGSGSGRIFISPLARKLLKEAGLTADQVSGTGPNGRIVRRDVDRAIAEARTAAPVAAVTPPTAPAAATPAAAATPTPAARPAFGAEFTEIPHTRLRRAVANRLTASKQNIPHFYVKRTARIDALLALRKQLNEVSPQKISVNDLVIRAVAVAHQAVPDANVIWTDEAMRRFDSVDIAVAIASERGLVTPVLRGVEKTSPSAIASQVKEFVKQANEGKLQQRDLEGGSISVTNLGMYGVEEFSAIINPPHSAILAVGAGQSAPAVVDGTVQVATQMALVLSVDHRAIDGALAAQWMDALVRTLEEPLRLLA
ncbi:MAG TPA: dihydrolipoamide acetyltransferase family protein [Amycolatopsis sp.]|nr:dihydrolipoamide acetyltransferase family protein [Amycolatopsis sp.]